MGRPVCNSSGTIAGVDTEASLEPVELLAVAWQVYATPFVNPETTIRVVLEDPKKYSFHRYKMRHMSKARLHRLLQW